MESVMSGVDLGPYRRFVQKMLWDPEPPNDQNSDQPVWCLGISYTRGTRGANNSDKTSPALAQPNTTRSPQCDAKPEESLALGSTYRTTFETVTSKVSKSLTFDTMGDDKGWPSAFLDDFESRFWMTYRCDFGPIPKSTHPRAASALSLPMRIKSHLTDQSGFSSDTGWGCMIRSGQSLLANAMALHTLGREWRRGTKPDTERNLLAKFADDPRAPYSIHQFVKHGAAMCGKYPGEWFGPSATARCIQALANEHEPQLRVYSTGDGPDVYQDGFMNLAKPDGQAFRPTLILVGTRLGIDKVTPVYWEALLAALQMPQSVGIAGGRPSSSHYFVGTQGLYLFYLDPHHTRPALPWYEDHGKYTEADVDSVHTRRLRRLHVREMDPSMLVGFLILDEEDWEDWKRNVKHVQGKAIIHVADHDPRMVREGPVRERRSAIDEVEILSDGDSDTALAS
ncbi:cysteine protease ATG4 [Sodiomyces alkalinus F11]|uniref:Cysteine protease n=1 Tax=Sodiomyces alkalinus (strain CBS 110278 / VKM F-3762 / F11) TaxID=1314773 RepID=A0A3N2PTU6_SODAK|nr:cysteine protease ATG4 [Sodiomyces alkalinus F11]ROT37927.1 cysteine protease ATG4 [Sodiomyces alkalinus F11]